jgi:two-component system sensor histidine kinase/response regulator
MLTSLKMKVDCAVDGYEALALLKKASDGGRSYDVVLLDWIMPGIDGIETARRIKADATLSKIPALLMVTANGREEANLEAKRVGLDAFLIKPVYPSVMYDTLLQLLGIEAAAVPRISRKKIYSAEGLQAIGGARILLVEDNEINQQVATEFLKDAGMKVEVVASGQEAIDAVTNSLFDMVLMDIQMPGMDGLEATRRIRANENLRDLPIVAMTAHAMVGDREKSLEAGMNDHVNKPVDPEVLYATLQRWIPAKRTGEIPAPVFSAARGSENEDVVLQLPVMTGIDQEEGLKRLNNNSKLFIKMLHDFRSSFLSTPDLLRKWADDGSWKEIQAKAHTVKGVSGYIGADRLFQAATVLEDALKLKKDDALLLLLPFLDALEEIIASLDLLPAQGPRPRKIAVPVENRVLDPVAAREKLQVMLQQLQHGELVPEELVVEIEGQLAGHFDEDLAQLVELLDDIEFEAATRVVEGILAALPQ